MRGASDQPHGSGLGKLPTLRARRDFVHVQSRGRRFKGRHAVVLVAPNHLDEARVGITVSRRVGNAVVRNRVRRRIREILRHHRALLCRGHDHVVVAFPRAASAPFAAFSEELICQLQRAFDSVSAKPS